MPDGDRALLMAALATGHSSDEACLRELASGATFKLSPNRVSVANLVSIYARRVRHLRASGTRFSGDDVVQRLQDSEQPEVRIASVHGSDNFSIFLSTETSRVIATIGVDGSVANQDFTDW